MTLRKKADYIVITAKNEAEWLKNRLVSGMQASDAAAAIGKSKYKTQLELWGEKTGLRQPRDLSNNEFVIRGKMREPIIREKFAQKHRGLSITHHPYDIYVSNKEGFRMIGATLDGEIEVVGENDWGLPIGYRGVLEIKTVSASEFNQEIVDGWNNGIIPAHYVPQVHQQLFAYNADFAIVQPEFDYGEDAENRYVMGEPILVETDSVMDAIEETINGVRDFWRYVETNTPPATSIKAEVAEGTEIVPIIADTEVGSFYQNFDAVKASVASIVAPYRGIEFTEDQMREAKEIKANLNKMVKEIDSKRLMVKRKYLQPLEYFESKANELKGVITEVINPISEQINEFEARREEEKRDLIEGIASELTLTMLSHEVGSFYLGAGGVDFDKRWLNKSFKESDIRNAITDQIDEFKTGYESIVAFSADDSELRSMMLAEYSRTKKLADAMKAKDRIEAAREQARIEEENRKRSKELLQRMRANAPAVDSSALEEMKAAPCTDPLPEKNPREKLIEANLITFSFEASHTSKEAWKALVEYMKSNGFVFKKLDR